MEALLLDERFGEGSVLQFVEVHMPKEDAPRALKMVASAGKD